MSPSAPSLQHVLDAVRAKSGAAKGQGVELLGVIGSVARGDAGPDSDVDIAYRVVGSPSLFDIGAILMDLQDALGRHVDMVDLAAVKPRLRATMERDLVRT